MGLSPTLGPGGEESRTGSSDWRRWPHALDRRPKGRPKTADTGGWPYALGRKMTGLETKFHKRNDPGGSRTPNLQIWNLTLYQLSYGAIISGISESVEPSAVRCGCPQ
eukprot:56357-Chlamydomonas_euryale.AAC.12